MGCPQVRQATKKYVNGTFARSTCECYDRSALDWKTGFSPAVLTRAASASWPTRSTLDSVVLRFGHGSPNSKMGKVGVTGVQPPMPIHKTELYSHFSPSLHE